MNFWSTYRGETRVHRLEFAGKMSTAAATSILYLLNMYNALLLHTTFRCVRQNNWWFVFVLYCSTVLCCVALRCAVESSSRRGNPRRAERLIAAKSKRLLMINSKSWDQMNQESVGLNLMAAAISENKKSRAHNALLRRTLIISYLNTSTREPNAENKSLKPDV